MENVCYALHDDYKAKSFYSFGAYYCFSGWPFIRNNLDNKRKIAGKFE